MPRAIFAMTYVTWMIRDMGLIEHTVGMQIIGGTALLGMSTLVSNGIVENRDGTYVLS